MLKSLVPALTALAVLFGQPVANAANVVLVVGQTLGSPEYIAGEAKTVDEIPTYLEPLFKFKGTQFIEARILRLAKLEDFAEVMNQNVNPEDRILGVVFVGHGATNSYALNANLSYSGAQIADVIPKALAELAKAHPSTPQGALMFYFHSCSCGRNQKNETNLLSDFLNQVKSQPELSGIWSEIHAIGHQDFSTRAAHTFQSRQSWFKHLFVKSGIPDIIYGFEMNLFRKYGRGALAQSQFIEGFITGIALGLIWGTQTFFNTALPDDVLVRAIGAGFAFYLGTMGGVVLSLPFQIMSYVRHTVVNTKTVGSPGTELEFAL